MDLRRLFPCFASVAAALVTLPSHAGVPATAEYTVRFQATWSAATHPDGFPPNPHFSPLVGGVHSDVVAFWEEGGLSSVGIEQMAELGRTRFLALEVEGAIAVGAARDVIEGGFIAVSPGSAEASFTVAQDFSLVTLVSMLAPSPDWFVGVSGLSLFESGNWVERKVVALHVYDAGTDSGSAYTSPDDDTDPQEPIRLFDTGPFSNGTAVGTFTFIRTDSPPPPPLFLNGGRFRAEAEWVDFEGNRGFGVAVQLTDDTGYFWFFDDSNVEVVVKVLTGCLINGRFWVFAGGLTNVEVTLRIEDTETALVQEYSNGLGEAFQPIQDTDAFATCPGVP